MRTLFYILFTSTLFAQPWSPDGICDYTDGGQWNNGGSKGCACTWLTFNEVWDTITNCAFGDCGQNALYECVYDCNGHAGYSTESIQRQCDATADPICWFNGNGSQGEGFCLGIIAMPVIFDEAEAYHTDGNNIIRWTTFSEYDASHYTIERSDSTGVFEHIATIPANGTTTTKSSYRFLDMMPHEGANHYRLIQYDYDGRHELLTVVYINNEPVVVLKTVDMMGKEVDGGFVGLVIDYLSDGSTRMRKR